MASELVSDVSIMAFFALFGCLLVSEFGRIR